MFIGKLLIDYYLFLARIFEEEVIVVRGFNKAKMLRTWAPSSRVTVFGTTRP
jgi:hypothetical protein